jgi:hypothetical protein
MTKVVKFTCSACEGTHVENQDFVALKVCHLCAVEVAKEFSRILCRWLPPVEIAEAVRRNTTEPAGSTICHSHDFCDANMAMCEAFNNLGITVDVVAFNNLGITVDVGASSVLWNAAWTIAFRAGFSLILCV